MSNYTDLKAAVDEARRTAAPHPEDPIRKAELAAALYLYGRAFYDGGEKDKAAGQFEEARALFRQLPVEYLSDVKYKTYYRMLLNCLVSYYESKNELEFAFELYENILDVDRRRIDMNTDKYDFIRSYLSNVDRTAKKYTDHSEPERALRLYEEKLGFFRMLLSKDPADKFGYRLNFNTELDRVIGSYREKNDTPKVIELDKEKTEVCKRIAADFPEYIPAFSGAALALFELGELTGDKEYLTQAKEFAERFPNDADCKRVIEKLS